MFARLSSFLLVLSLSGLSACTSTKTGGGGGRNPYLYPESRLGDARSVKTASTDGRFLFLDDGSIWNVNWNDTRTAARWNPGDRVTIRRSSSNSYPYEITSGSGGSVSARHGKRLD